jgi:hypothetical protein
VVPTSQPDWGGGAICGVSGLLTIRRSTFVANRGSNGGAIVNRNVQTTIEDSRFEDNATQASVGDPFNGGVGGGGGAIYIDGTGGGALTLRRTVFSGNQATNMGGAIFSWLYGLPTALVIEDYTFANNAAVVAGGAITHANGRLAVSGSTFSGNTVVGHGGALYETEANGSQTPVSITIVDDRRDQRRPARGDGRGGHGRLPFDGDGRDVVVRPHRGCLLSGQRVRQPGSDRHRSRGGRPDDPGDRHRQPRRRTTGGGHRDGRRAGGHGRPRPVEQLGFPDDSRRADDALLHGRAVPGGRHAQGRGQPGRPALAAGVARTFPISGTCGVPATAWAVSLNVTVTQPTAAGNVRLFPGGTPAPLASTVNYRAGITRANNATAALGTAGDLTALASQASGTVHLILDVDGYFE